MLTLSVTQLHHSRSDNGQNCTRIALYFYLSEQIAASQQSSIARAVFDVCWSIETHFVEFAIFRWIFEKDEVLFLTRSAVVAWAPFRDTMERDAGIVPPDNVFNPSLIYTWITGLNVLLLMAPWLHVSIKKPHDPSVGRSIYCLLCALVSLLLANYKLGESTQHSWLVGFSGKYRWRRQKCKNKLYLSK